MYWGTCLRVAFWRKKVGVVSRRSLSHHYCSRVRRQIWHCMSTSSALFKGSGSVNFSGMWPRMQPVVSKLLRQERVFRDEWQDLRVLVSLYWPLHHCRTGNLISFFLSLHLQTISLVFSLQDSENSIEQLLRLFNMYTTSDLVRGSSDQAQFLTARDKVCQSHLTHMWPNLTVHTHALSSDHVGNFLTQ